MATNSDTVTTEEDTTKTEEKTAVVDEAKAEEKTEVVDKTKSDENAGVVDESKVGENTDVVDEPKVEEKTDVVKSEEADVVKSEETDVVKSEETVNVEDVPSTKIEDEQDDKKEPGLDGKLTEESKDNVTAEESIEEKDLDVRTPDNEEKVATVTQDDDEKKENGIDESKVDPALENPTPRKRGRPPKKVPSPVADKEVTPKVKEPEKKVVPEATAKDEEEKPSKKRKSESAMVLGAVGREGTKRERKSADAFQPATFEVDRSVTIIQGRGTPLEDLPICRNAIDSINSDQMITTVHRFLFSHRGKPSTKEMKKNILKFNGFLTKEVDPDEEKQDKIDNVEEAKMGQKAYKMKVAELRALCDFFAVDRLEAKDKDGLVDALLDFLGAPNESFLKGGKKLPSKKRNRPAKIEDEDIEMEDVDKVKAEPKKTPKKEKGSAKKESKKETNGGTPKTVSDPTTSVAGKLPSDSELREWVGAYVKCYNMSKSTIKHALSIASEKFDVDITPLKPKLKQFLTEAL